MEAPGRSESHQAWKVVGTGLVRLRKCQNNEWQVTNHMTLKINSVKFKSFSVLGDKVKWMQFIFLYSSTLDVTLPFYWPSQGGTAKLEDKRETTQSVRQTAIVINVYLTLRDDWFLKTESFCYAAVALLPVSQLKIQPAPAHAPSSAATQIAHQRSSSNSFPSHDDRPTWIPTERMV